MGSGTLLKLVRPEPLELCRQVLILLKEGSNEGLQGGQHLEPADHRDFALASFKVEQNRRRRDQIGMTLQKDIQN